MTKAPKKSDSRAKALAGMTKAELVRTVKQLDKRQTALLNEIAALKATAALCIDEGCPQAGADHVCINPNSLETTEIEIKDPSEQEGFKIASRPLFPWETKPEGE